MIVKKKYKKTEETTGNSAPKKRSLTVKGHQTSVSLEEPFWQYFGELASHKNLSFNELASIIDMDRPPKVGLATSIRLFCLKEAKKNVSCRSGIDQNILSESKTRN